MKLNDVRPNVETSGDLEEKLFGIEDQGMIFDILRNKMYSNPILAICREITCNARDAHREVGNPAPIQIHLPNNMEPYFKVTDFGPGISPDRMANIFIKYTASTKRNDNTQTGGFGLGAKTPFSYSDSFSIITNYNGVQYNYNAFIDPSKIGKLALGSEAPTTEPNGTTIIIPVQAKNYHEFQQYAEQACRHWDVKPIIKGGTIKWPEFSPILEGKDWSICSNGNDWNRSAVLIIDGIEYPCPLDTLRKYANASLIDSSRGNLLLTFGIGELTLSASRENVYWDEVTQKAIKNRMTSVQAEIKKRVTDKIDTFPDLWTANIYYRDELRQGFHDIKFLGTLQWKGMDLTDNYCDTGCATFHFKKGGWSRKKGHDPNRLKRATTHHLTFEKTSALFINDLPLKEPTPRHVRKAFDDDPKLTSVQVVCPNDKYSLADLNKDLHLDKMAPRLLSSITKASSRQYTPASQRVLVFQFMERACGFKQSSYSAMEEDSQDKVLCLLTRDSSTPNRNVILKNKKEFQLQALRWLAQKHPTISFYGVDSTTTEDRIEEDFSDLTPLDDFLEEQVENKKIDFLEVKYSSSERFDLDHNMMRNIKKIEKLIDDKDSLFIKRLRLHVRLNELRQGDSYLLTIYESVNGEITKGDLTNWLKDHPDHDWDKLEKEYTKSYPLIEHLHYYNFDEVGPAISHYINIVDKN